MTENTNYQICSKTVMDTSDPDIWFDEQGISNHYYEFQIKREKEVFDGTAGAEKMKSIAQVIKKKGHKKDYDCIIGLSGGVDSSYVAHVVVNLMGLRPLAIHMDNGWNSELAVANIENIVSKLNIDLHTKVLDWDEFRSLQRAFLMASVGNVEMTTDHAINATLFELTKKFNVKYIISGSNVNSEGILQSAFWGHDNKDWVNIEDINKRFGNNKLKNYPKLSSWGFAHAIFLRGVRFIPILNYVNFNKADAMEFLEKNLGWRNYGRKHGESIFTRFFQEYYLPRKFNVDKRRSHLSSLICSGQLSRENALAQLQKPLLSAEEEGELVEFVCKKLGFSQAAWSEIMNASPESHLNFRTSKLLSVRESRLYKYGRKVATGRDTL